MFHHIVPYMQTFVLILCTILFLEAHAVSYICQICTCYQRTKVYCKHRKLTSVPQPIPMNIELLSLEYNNIEKIERGVFNNLKYLKKLYLNGNNISSIEQGSFQGLPRLQLLSIHLNNIPHIEKGIFQDLPSLEQLYLYSNNISSIEEGGFHALPRLQILYLNNNTIEKIDPGIFYNLTNLQLLTLSFNKIEKIEHGIFQNLTNLQKLYLTGNNILSIEEGSFQGLNNLQLLFIRKNNITHLERGTFQNLPNLKELYAYRNNISSIEQGTFQGLPRLEILYLKNNTIENIDRGTFHGLTNLQLLTLEYNKIDKIERGIFQNLYNLQKLFLNGNDISSIEEESFEDLRRLQQLSLHRNNISHIKKGTFKGLPFLEKLYLYSNNISSIEQGSFKDLPKLQTLYLKNNTIKKIDRLIFHKLTSLELLTFEHNKIEKVERGTFQDLINLQKLYLNGNDISNIEHGSFQGLYRLQQLSLHINNISHIKKGIFQDLPILKKLYIYRNNISSIDQGSFQSLPRLQMLTLEHNKIEKIERGIFQGLNNLQKLRLNGNNISSIEQGSFQGLPRLQQLYLNNNPIQKYEDGAFLFLRSIDEINLENNDDMVCGCHLPAFVQHIKKVYGRTVDVNGTCQEASGRVIPILKYSQCQNYSLFQRHLQCQTCSRMICNDSDVTSCPETMPVCRFTLSTNGVTLKTEKSCSTYRKCVQAMRDNTAACDKWPSGTSCAGCCVGTLCNENDFIGWTKSFVFHLAFKKFNEYKITTVNISRAMEHELLNVTGIFRVEYCGFDHNKIIYTMYCSVLSKITEDQLRRNISRVLTKSQALHDLGVQQSHMKLVDEMVCDESTTSANNRTFYWPMTKIGTTAEIPCHAHVATRYCSPRTVEHIKMASSQYTISPKCSPFTGIWQDPDMSQCYNTEWITRQLKDIARKNIDKGNIDNISKEILDISQKSVYFKEEHIVLTVEILEKMVPLISKVSANITLGNVLRCISNLINIPEEDLAGAEEEKRSANRLLDIIESIPEKIPLEEKQVTAIYSNLGIGVAKVNRDTFDGLFYGVSYGTNETEGSTMINRSPNPDQQEVDVKNMASISLPRSLLKHLKDEERASISRITFFSMRDDKLYRVTQNSSNRQNARINGHVLAANVPDIPIGNLDEPVDISFNLIHQNASNLQCVYWDESPGLNPHWSPKCCNISKHEPGKEVVCSCDYLTSFALLADIYQNEGETENAFSIISNIGCGISLAFLILTIIIHVCFRNLWDLMSSKVLVSLCSSLAVTNFIFLVGMQSYVQIMAVCKAVAAVLHYFLLTSVMWMSVEAFYVYLSVVVEFKTYQASFRKSSILAWGLPAVIVIITLAINYTDNYTKIAEICWLSGPSFYAAILTPVVMILIFNFIMLSLVIWRLVSLQRNKRSEHKRSKVRVLGLVGLLLLLGLTWVFAFLAVHEATKVFEYLFTIFNTLQGMFIFIFYCIYKKDTRDVLKEFVNERQRMNQWKITAGTSSSSVNEIMDKTTETNI